MAVLQHGFILVMSLCVAAAVSPPSPRLAPSPSYSRKLTNNSRLCQKAWSNSGIGTDQQKCVNKEVVELDPEGNSPAEWAKWKAAGKVLIGYISVGSLEEYRDDAAAFPKGSYWPQAMNGWPDEHWIRLDRWQDLKPVMLKRMQRIKSLGGDGYEGDNIAIGCDGCSERYASLTKTQRLAAIANNTAYAKWLANTAHSLGLFAVFKNGGALAGDCQGSYDAVISESAVYWGDWDPAPPKYPKGPYATYLAANKPVWDIEYLDEYSTAAKVKAAIARKGYNNYATSIQWDSGKVATGYVTVGGFAPAP